jgi:hypothetical protein
MRSIRFFSEQGQNRGSGVQEIYITVRYPYTTRYEQLPLSDLEAAYISLSYGLFHDAQAIADVISIEIDQTDMSITVAEDPAGVESPGLDYGDWITTLRFNLSVLWVAEPELTGLTGNLDNINITVTKLNIGLWRKPLLTGSDSLDCDLTFNNDIV